MLLDKRLLLFGLILVWSSPFMAQNLCDGNLGENIFEGGDFGTGISNILSPNPGIAPGYSYTFSVPPVDGFYTITNNTAPWGNLWDSWLQIQDNSSDPNGYMMVVNASIDPGVFFEQTIDGLCGSTTYEFSADVINMIKLNIADHIKPNVSFILDGATQFSTGSIPQNNQWNTYGFTFTTPPGVTQMTLTLQNNAPGGIGNDLAIDNISFRACGPSAFIDTDQNIFLCADANDPAAITADLDLNNFFIQWQLSVDDGNTWTDLVGEDDVVYFHDEFLPGVYWYRYLSATSEVNLMNFKCRILSDVIRIEVLPITYEVADTTCEGSLYLLGIDTLVQSGIYVGELISSKGCDSIVTLDLTVLEDGLTFEVNSEIPTCPEIEDGRIEIGNVENGIEPYTYFLNGEVSSLPVFSDLGGDIYHVRVEDQFHCNTELTIDITNDEIFSIHAGEDLTLAFGEISNFVRVQSTQNIASINWTPANFLTCDDCTTLQISGAQAQTYQIEALNDKGCVAYDSLKVLVNSEDINIYIPNAFSPNGDGANDYFSLFAFEQTVISIASMKIFNRWGALVFEDNNMPINEISSGWNGRQNGTLVQSGVYPYWIELVLIDGRLIRRAGSITVLY